MENKKYLPSETAPVNKHFWRPPGWVPAQRYHEYQESRARAARVEHDKIDQATERHNAFIENAQKHAIPISKTKKK